MKIKNIFLSKKKSSNQIDESATSSEAQGTLIHNRAFKFSFCEQLNKPN